MFSVRCYTCNAVVAHKRASYDALAKTHEVVECFDKLEIRRMCCRRMFLGYAPVEQVYGNEAIRVDDGVVIDRHVTFARTYSCD